MQALHIFPSRDHLKTIKAGIRWSRDGLLWFSRLSSCDLLSGMKNAYREGSVKGSVQKRKIPGAMIKLSRNNNKNGLLKSKSK